MSHRLYGLLATALLVVACGGPGAITPRPVTPQPATPQTATPVAVTAAPVTAEPQTPAPTTAPVSEPPATVGAETGAPSGEPSMVPGASLDPSASDAGVVARVTITNDTRGDRDGTHDIIGIADDGSYCSQDLSTSTYTAVAWFDAAGDGQIHRFSITVPNEDIPTEDGQVTGVEDGRVSLDFVSESGFGTQYDGDRNDANYPSSVTLDVAREGDGVVFSFQATTWDEISFEGQLICADAHV